MAGLEDLRREVKVELASLAERVAYLERRAGNDFPGPAGAGLPTGAGLQPTEPAGEDPDPSVVNLQTNTGGSAAVGSMTTKAGFTLTDHVESRVLSEQTELYTFRESLWDVQMLLGEHMGVRDSVLVLMFVVLNIVVQACFCAVVHEMSTESITDEGIEQYAHWRITEGHKAEYYDELTGSSMIRRACSNFGANVVAGNQQLNMLNYGKYLTNQGVTLGFAQGPWVCTLGILLWAATVMVDLWNVEHFVSAVLSLPRESEARTSFSVTKDARVKLNFLSTKRCVFIIVTIAIPRVLVDIGLILAGIRFLAYENTLPGLILNAVALAFILSLDTMFFQLLPRRAQTLVQNMEPVEKRRNVARRGSLDWRSLGMFLGVVLVVVFALLAYVLPRAEKMKEANDLLCGGELDFIVAEERGTGFIHIAPTKKELEVSENVRFGGYAVLQRTELLGSVDAVSRYAEGAAGPQFYTEVGSQEALEISRSSSSENLQALPCSDADSTDVKSRALTSWYLKQYSVDAKAGSFCMLVQASGNCTRQSTRSWARKVCPMTCLCASPALYNRDGCSAACDDRLAVSLRELSGPCHDVTFRNTGGQEGARDFFQGVTEHLLQQNSICYYDYRGSGNCSSEPTDRIILSPDFTTAFQRRSDGHYIIPKHPRFLHVSNMSTWLSGGYDVETLSQLESPCKLLPFFFGVFGLDLCAAFSLRWGTVSGYCPEACGEPTCGPATALLTSNLQLLDAYQLGINLTDTKRVIFPRVVCSNAQRFTSTPYLFAPTHDIFFFEQPSWGNGHYTLDWCNTTGLEGLNDGSLVNFSALSGEFFDLNASILNVSAPSSCEVSEFLGDTLDESRFVGVIRKLGPSAPKYLKVKLVCGVDGYLSCGSTLNVSTVGAVNRRGGPGPENLFGMQAPVAREISFSTCGSEMDARLNLLRFWRSNSELFEALLKEKEIPRSSACDEEQRLVFQSPQDINYLALVIEGLGADYQSASGSFSVRMDCAFPAISCGDQLTGETTYLTHVYGSEAREMIWRFNTGAAGGTFVFDACGSNFDADLRLFSANMTQLEYNDFWNYTACLYSGKIVYSAPANTELNILLEGFGDAAGNYTMHVTCEA